MSLLHILDVSAYQSADVLEKHPVMDVALVKITEGKSYVSSQWKAQYASAKTRARRRGGYHFARPEQSSAHDQCSRFLDLFQPADGEIAMLDLEASKLSQAATNKWAREFGDEFADQAPKAADWLYMGSGYATNNTGKGLASHFGRWMYPQYPSAYQVTVNEAFRMETEELRRTANRSSLIESRHLIASLTTKWPPTVSPWLPSGVAATGWSKPDIWQFTDNWNGLDASVTALTLDQLAGSGAHPLEDEEMYAQASGYPPPMKVGERHSHTCPSGKINIWGFWFNSPHKLTYRIDALSAKGGGDTKTDLVVGGPASDKDSWPAKATWTTHLDDVRAFSIELVKAEGPTEDWDPTMPGADGTTVFPGWDASHTG
jgi:hypothetical protein